MRTACVDIGGTYLKTGVLENGVLHAVRETPTHAQRGAQEMLARVAELVRGMGDVACVGLSTAGEVDAAAGQIRLCDNIPGYTGMNPKTVLEAALDLPVQVENDVNAAAAGEYAFGAAQGLPDFLMVSYGTGVGGAIFMGGQLYRGSADSAGEFGGLLTHPEAVRAQDQGSGSYERYASTAALVARASARFAQLTSGRAIFEQLEVPEVRALLDEWIDEVAFGLVSLIHTFNPAAIVLGGGIMREPLLCDALRERLRPMVKPSFQTVTLVPAHLGNNAGMMGAGYLANCAQKR